MEPEHYLNKIKDVFIAMPIRVLAERLRALQGRVKTIENTLTPPGARPSSGIAVFYQQIVDLTLGAFIPPRAKLGFANVSLADRSAEDATYIEPYFNKFRVNGVDQFQASRVEHRGSTVDALIEPAGLVITHSDYSPGLQADGPTNLDIGVINDGEFLKRVGGTIVSSAGGGGGSTASNGNVGGVGVYDSAVGSNLVFRGVNAASSKITVTLDAPNKEIDLDVPDATTAAKGAVELATNGEVAANVVVQGNDSRLVVGTGTGFRHVTVGVEDAASKLVDTADINNSQVTYAKIQNIANSTLVGRGSLGGLSGVPEAILLGTGLGMSGTNLNCTLSVPSTSYTPGSLSILTGNFGLMVKTLQLTGAQRLTIAGTGRLRIT
jgi:hypothetical protein